MSGVETLLSLRKHQIEKLEMDLAKRTAMLGWAIELISEIAFTRPESSGVATKICVKCRLQSAYNEHMKNCPVDAIQKAYEVLEL